MNRTRILIPEQVYTFITLVVKAYLKRSRRILYRLVVLLFFIAVGGNASSLAQVAGWTSHTAMRQVSAIDASETHMWSASNGGVFSYDVSTEEITTYTVVDGLHAVNVRTIVVDDRRDFTWVGYGDGVIDRIHVPSREIVSYRDIERATQFSARGINRIVMQGDSLLIATEFGIVVFDPVKIEVRDTYARLGDNPPATEVFDVVIGPDDNGVRSLWVATINGVARAALSAVNLQDPTEWEVERLGFGFGSEIIRSLAFFNGSLFAGTNADVYRRDVGGVYQPLGLTTDRAVTDLSVSGDIMVGVERFILLGFDQSGRSWTFNVTGFQDPVSITGNVGTGFWFGDAARGLTSIPEPSFDQTSIEARFTVVPIGPHDGFFSDLDVDDEGNVWAGGVRGRPGGFYKLSAEREWTTYSFLFNPELEGKNEFIRIHIDAKGTGWAGAFGSSLASASAEGEILTYDESNSSLLNASGFVDFIIIGGIDSDESGTVWVTTIGSALTLHALDSDGTWHGFEPYVGSGLSNRADAYGRIFIDSFDQKWILVRDENNFQKNKGLLVVDTGDTEAKNDDLFQFFGSDGSAGQGLPSTAVLSVAEDRDGLVWLGTESGPAYFVNTGIVASDESARAIWPQWADRSQGTFMLFGLQINDVAIDPANQIWFATNDGAWLVRSVEGGYETVNHFTEDNSPLFSNEVLSVVVDGNTGEVFFSTSSGLVSYAGEALTPSVTTRDLFVYPNPARFTNTSAPSIYIEGLVEETEIRIVTATGSLVRKLSARGGRTLWDGRDEVGNLVRSGVYLIVAVGTEDSGAAYGKVAIIR